ncbi:hypothetical protein RJ639_030794 [Escallonia herrerae]|uniref:GDSL esterase/lipase At5g03980-like n=1 Tax=Escallonia herrerae TaxID=1293975 RepID=A0AA88WXU8_9ASTE|nr:hypothetical protein RJ639_030794 [Escallonia herrerae]
MLKNSLIIEGNDYNYAFFQRKSIKEVKNMIPDVVQAIKRAARDGAIRVIVPGNFPIGILPIYLTAFQMNNSAAYDGHHCLKSFNNFAMDHNERLQQAIKELKEEYHNATIVYGNYYDAFQWLYGYAHYLETTESLLRNRGDYDFSLGRMCGAPSVPVCDDPNRHISWDGVHLTHEANRVMATWLIRDIFPKLKCYN